MKEEKLEKKVVEVINNELKEFKRQINTNSNGKWRELELNADLGLDSLKVVEIFMECENIFNVSFDDEEIMKSKTVGDLINKIIEKTSI